MIQILYFLTNGAAVIVATIAAILVAVLMTFAILTLGLIGMARGQLVPASNRRAMASGWGGCHGPKDHPVIEADYRVIH